MKVFFGSDPNLRPGTWERGNDIRGHHVVKVLLDEIPHCVRNDIFIP